MTVYRLFWDEFSAWYLEAVKPGYKQPMDPKTYASTIGFLDTLVKLLHPFMPFITEEIWQLLEKRESGDTIMDQAFPSTKKFDAVVLKAGEQMKEIVTAIRNIRKDKNIPFKEPLHLVVKDINGQYDHHFEPVIQKLGHIDKVDFTDEEIKGVLSFRVQSIEIYVPLDDEADHEEELEKLQEELKYTKGFLKTVMKKLDNERFVGSAPAQVVKKEQQKKEDAEKKIEVLEARISNLRS